MKLLLDTNAFYCYAADEDRLSRDVKSLLAEDANLKFISAESVKELIVAYRRKGLGRRTWKSEEDIIRSIIEDFFIEIRPVTQQVLHTYANLTLNTAEEHNDPSDHIIIAQAITEKMTLISSDRKFPFYREQGLELVMND